MYVSIYKCMYISMYVSMYLVVYIYYMYESVCITYDTYVRVYVCMYVYLYRQTQSFRKKNADSDQTYQILQGKVTR